MPKMRNIKWDKINALSRNARLTREQAAELLDVSAGTLANYNYAGLLPYVPSRPITVLAGDLKICAKMVSNGISKQLHRGLRIKPEDCPTYSRLDGVLSLTSVPFDMIVDRVVHTTGKLYRKYQKEGN